MSKKTTFSQEQINEIIRLYTEEMMGTPSIATEFKTHKTIIARTLRENNIEMDQPGRRNLGGKSASDKRNYYKHKTKKSEYHKEWSKKNRKNLRKYHGEWREENREELRKKQAIWEKKKCETDAKYKLGKRTRTAVYTCLKEANVAKYRSTFETLGYTLEELMNHLEKQFVDGMSWENYGQWHVDHKIPMARFNFTSVDDPEFRLCWCLDNLQPLWDVDNLSKGARYLC